MIRAGGRLPAAILAAAGMAGDHPALALPSVDGAAERAVAAALTEGWMAGRLDAGALEGTLAWLAGPMEPPDVLPEGWRDLPQTRLMHCTRIGLPGPTMADRLGRPDWDRHGVACHAFWFAHLAPAAFRWPAPLWQDARRWFGVSDGMAIPDLPLTRAMMLPWRARADLQTAFPLRTTSSRAEYVLWLLTRGIGDLGLSVAELDERLPIWLSRPSRRLQAVPLIMELLLLGRSDLASAFDVGTEHGRLALKSWGLAHFAASYAGTGLLAIDPAAAEERCGAAARAIDVGRLCATPV